MHLITIASLEDLTLVQEACKRRFRQWSFTIRNTDTGECLEATWIPTNFGKRKKTQLTIAESHIMFNLLPAFAQAFYEGMCIGRQSKV